MTSHPIMTGNAAAAAGNPHAQGISGYYGGSQAQHGAPQAYGSGQAANWVPYGLGQIPDDLSALFRVAAHDAYSGVDQYGHSYIDGDLGIKALFFPDDPAVKPILERPYLRQALIDYTKWDIMDDYQINGSPARQIFSDVMYYGTGINIKQQLHQAPLRNADLSWAALQRPNVDNGNPEGFRIQAEWMGLSNNELGALVTGGHDFLPNPLDDLNFNGSTLINAMNHPLHPDYANTQGVPGLKNYFQTLVGRDVNQFGTLNGWHLAQDMTRAVLKMFYR